MSPAVRRLLPFVGRYRRSFAIGLACVVVSTAIQLLSPWVLKHAIDDLTAGVTRDKLGFYAAACCSGWPVRAASSGISCASF
jgi:ABC-type multidrug transport system fused ATPase/permease subunit